MAALILLHCVFRKIELDAARRDGPVPGSMGDVVPPVALMSHATAPAAAVAPGSMGDVVPRRARSRSRSRPRTPSPWTSTLQSLRSQNATLRQDVAALRHWAQVNFGHVGAGAAHDRRAIQEIRDWTASRPGPTGWMLKYPGCMSRSAASLIYCTHDRRARCWR